MKKALFLAFTLIVIAIVSCAKGDESNLSKPTTDASIRGPQLCGNPVSPSSYPGAQVGSLFNNELIILGATQTGSSTCCLSIQTTPGATVTVTNANGFGQSVVANASGFLKICYQTTGQISLIQIELFAPSGNYCAVIYNPCGQ